MPCPECNYAYSKGLAGQGFNQAFRRKRTCLKCEAVFVTYEVRASDWQMLMELRRWNASMKDMPASE